VNGTTVTAKTGNERNCIRPDCAGTSLVLQHALAAVAVIVFIVSPGSAARASADDCAANRPAPRSSHSLTYDTARRRIVMFGGVTNDTADRFPASLWSWDGGAWTCTSAPGPAGRIDAFLAFDEARAKLVLFGGRRVGPNRTSQYFLDTWEWDGRAWSLRDSAGPGPRIHGAIAYDPARRRVVISGGGGEQAGRPDTWEWDGVRWREIPVVLPEQNLANALVRWTNDLLLLTAAVDPAPECVGLRRARLYSLGSNDALTDLGTPGPCFSPQAPVAPTADGLLLFAGWDGPSTPAATWLWSGRAWRKADSAPTKRRGTAVAYDAARRRIVMFGGDGEAGLLGDIWEWDGAKWISDRQLSPDVKAGRGEG
jgi:hypothetical protein